MDTPSPGPDKTAGSGSFNLLCLHAVLAVLAITYGLQFSYTAAWRILIFRTVSLVVVASMTLLLVNTFGRLKARPRGNLDKLAAVLCLCQFALTLFFNLPTRTAIPAIFILFLVAAFLGKRVGPVAVIFWAIGCGIALFVKSILTIPFTAQGGDMLPFIAHAIDIFRAGGDPYAANYGVIDKNPFFYLPAQWLVYLPARELGIDLRLMNLIAAAAMIALVEFQNRLRVKSLRAAIYPIMLSPMALAMMHSGQVWPYWLTLLVGAILVLDGRFIWAAVVFALAASIRQTALIPAAIIFVASTRQLRPAALLGAAAAGAATLACSILPFVTSPAAWKILLTDGPKMALIQAHLEGNPADQVSLSNLLDWLHLESWDTRIELMLALIAMGLALAVGKRGPSVILAFAGMGYAWTISANPYMHPYYYVGGVLLAAIGIAAQFETRAAPATAEPA